MDHRPNSRTNQESSLVRKTPTPVIRQSIRLTVIPKEGLAILSRPNPESQYRKRVPDLTRLLLRINAPHLKRRPEHPTDVDHFPRVEFHLTGPHNHR
jgi:hypothetical protein